MAISGTRAGVFEQIERWHRNAVRRLNCVEIWYVHFRHRDQNQWSMIQESLRSLREQLKDEGELPAWIRSWFSCAAEEETLTYAGVSGKSCDEVAFKLTDRMLSVGVTKSFVGMLKPLDSLVPLMTLLRTEYDQVCKQLNYLAAPDEIISVFRNEGFSEQPLKRPQGSNRNPQKARIKKLLRHGVSPGWNVNGRS